LTATALGIRSLHSGTLLSSLNRGLGVDIVEGQADFAIIARDGTRIEVDLTGARTMGDVIAAIQSAIGPALLTVSLASSGNGITITDATPGPGALQFERLNGSAALDDLGLFGKTASGGGPSVSVTSDDVNEIVPDGVFSALIRLRDGLLQDDTSEINLAGQRLAELIKEVTNEYGLVGVRAQALSARRDSTEDAVLASQQMLSEVMDLDYTEAVARFAQTQTALQAALMTGSRLLNLSLLDFLE
jgi:flagellin-like hook-associated protein FlgL